MSPLVRIAQFAWRAEKPALWRGMILSVAVLVAGALLLGLSGWFITAAGAAGLAGIGILFDVFRPSAGVRFLALGRTAARYGERILTHDATLRVLARLRVRLLDRLAARDAAELARLRSAELLNRIMADVDALDGLAIRLIFPVLAGATTLLMAASLLSWLVSPAVAISVVGLLVAGGAATMLWLGRPSVRPAAEAEAARQDLRSSAVEHLRGRIVLAFAGRLPASRAAVLDLGRRLGLAEGRLYGFERRATILSSTAGLLASAAALAIGGSLVLAGQISPAVAAIAVFASLALTEVLAPLQRAMAEIGRMRDAAGRVAPMLDARPVSDTITTPHAITPTGAPALRLDGLCFAAPGSLYALTAPVTLTVRAGEMMALSGRSGMGKSTLLSVVAGLVPPVGGRIEVFGQPFAQLDEPTLRQTVGVLPQRSQMMSGTVRDAMHLAAPDVSDAEIWQVLDALGLSQVLAPRGGLDAMLGERGAGLSGGESRRLALARVLLRRPDILLLDEPTEGLDAAMARQVLRAIRQLLPQAAILITTHKAAEQALCTHQFHLKDIN